MKKELKPTHESVSCDACGRTILKGETVEPYLAGGERKRVCELCRARATAEGWIPEAHGAAVPGGVRSRASGRRSLLGRLRRRDADAERELPLEAAPPLEHEQPAPADAPPEFDDGEYAEPAYEGEQAYVEEGAYEDGGAAAPPNRAEEPRPGPRDPRHVRAVPSSSQLKVEQALDLFNASEHPRTIAGIARTLGAPWVSANPLADTPSAVAVVVAWELSWYRYRVDLADGDAPVTLVGTGQELDELAPELREWNAAALPDGEGQLAVAAEVEAGE